MTMLCGKNDVMYVLFVRQTHIIQLKQALVAKEEEMVKLTQKSESCYCQLVEAQRNIAQLETR